MGKKRIVKKSGQKVNKGLKARALSRGKKKKLSSGTLYINASFNNTMVLLSDKNGNAVMAASAGSLGFKGAKKSTPYAAAKVGEMIGEKAAMIGLKEVNVVVKGVGQGRESAIRGFIGKGIDISKIQDRTPIPHNGPRPPKARRV